MPRIGCIVEGLGDATSIPIIVRRIASHEGIADLEVVHPMRVSRHRVVREGELERAVELTARTIEASGGILITLDADDDLPCELGPRLLERAHSARSDVRSAVVLANREKEAWFIAALESLRGKRGIAQDALPPDQPEAIRGAKEWISRVMGSPYSEITDQPALAAAFDLDTARRRSPSFDKFWRDVRWLLESR